MGPGKDTHGTRVPEREGRGWPTTRSTVRQTCTTKRKTPLSSNNVHGSGALSPVSSARIQQRTEQVVQRRQEVDGQLVGSLNQLWRTPRMRSYSSWKTNSAQLRTRVTHHQHSGGVKARHQSRAGRSQSTDKKCNVGLVMNHQGPVLQTSSRRA